MLKSQKGQSLIEYLVIVALMAVATIGIVRSLNQATTAKFAEIVYVLQGQKKKIAVDEPDKNLYKKKDFGDFMAGAASREEQQRNESP